MPDTAAIEFSGVSKVYQLYGSQTDQLISVLGLHRIGLHARSAPHEFKALRDIDLIVPRGHKIGVIGRNGAGKTTLLKLICGNFGPTSGTVKVNGTVQALMTSGTGFHPEHTGRENVLGSLQYNGLSRDDYAEALQGIIDFCELGEFLDQPLKTYSLGMQARLMFATATAIQPDILIVDEILGAGDAYFVAKSKQRVTNMVHSGCTMLLVSHSMQQVLELCDEAIWLDAGSIRMRGPTFDVVKAYEAELHAPISRLRATQPIHKGAHALIPAEVSLATVSKGEQIKILTAENLRTVNLQEPTFRPHVAKPDIVEPTGHLAFEFVAKGGISRWGEPQGLSFSGFSIVHERGVGNVLLMLQPAKFLLEVTALSDGEFTCRYAINVSDQEGRSLCAIRSSEDRFSLGVGHRRRIACMLNPVQLGPGDYVIGVVVMGYGPIETINNADRFDLLSRSFQFSVEAPASFASATAEFMHTAEWQFDQRA